MAWTHFKITEFGIRTTPKVNGVVAVIGTWYPKVNILTIEKNNPAHLGEPFDVLKYQVTDGEIVSNTANLVVDCPPDLSIAPTSSNQNITAAVSTTYDVIDNIPYSNGVDRIRIVDFENIGSLELNGIGIFPGVTIFHYDFENLKYTTNLGIGVPYQKIQYQVGNSAGFNPTIYKLEYNIAGLSSLMELTEDTGQVDFDIDNPPNPDTNYKEATFKITNGVPFADAEIEIIINLAATAFPGGGSQNSVIITANGTSFDYQANTTVTKTITLDADGECLFELQSGFLIGDVVTGDITFNLLSIDSDPLLVNGLNNSVIYTYSF